VAADSPGLSSSPSADVSIANLSAILCTPKRHHDREHCGPMVENAYFGIHAGRTLVGCGYLMTLSRRRWKSRNPLTPRRTLYSSHRSNRTYRSVSHVDFAVPTSLRRNVISLRRNNRFLYEPPPNGSRGEFRVRCVVNSSDPKFTQPRLNYEIAVFCSKSSVADPQRRTIASAAFLSQRSRMLAGDPRDLQYASRTWQDKH